MMFSETRPNLRHPQRVDGCDDCIDLSDVRDSDMRRSTVSGILTTDHRLELINDTRYRDTGLSFVHLHMPAYSTPNSVHRTTRYTASTRQPDSYEDTADLIFPSLGLVHVCLHIASDTNDEHDPPHADHMGKGL